MMGLLKKYFNQTRKPEGVLGKLMIRDMNGGHAKLADWGMAYLKDVEPQRIAELGCGGGRNASALLTRYSNAYVSAVDYSALSVEKATTYNAKSIAAGRCEVLQGDVSSLPLQSEAYDLATAFETVYFWPGIEKCFAEVARVLKPGGVFLICNESDGTDAASLKFEQIIEGMKCHTAEQMEAALKAVGFTAVTAYHHPSKPWLAVLAKK